jgi:arsenite-transporting ATPase
MSTRYVFFSGKGGVGKTTMACATAVDEAAKGHRTLIVTTDPASNLADVFEQTIGHRVRPIDGVPNLWAMEIDADQATEEYRDRVLGPFRTTMPASVLAVIEEQFRSPCTTEIASFDRFVDLLDGADWDVVVFDTAPTGHTLRLLELPVDWSRHIEDSARGAGQTCLGPVQAIQESKGKYDQAIALLTDPQRTRFVFVLQPDRTAMFETERATAELLRIGIQAQELIVNGVLPTEACERPLFRRRYEAQQQRLAEIRRRFTMPLREVSLRQGEVKGVAGLRDIARSLSGGAAEPISTSAAIRPAAAPRRSGTVPWGLLLPRYGKPKAIFFAGKGGVGKTSVSCLAAVRLAREGWKTLLLTTDPAAHLGQVLDVAVGSRPDAIDGVPNLWAAQIDPKQATEDYKTRVLDEARARHSPETLLALEEELASPCTEEIAAFDKFTEYADGDGWDVVVFDTAPTGHTLRLLELPFDYSQQVEMMVNSSGEGNALREETRARFERIIDRLRDPERTVFAFVVLPESTPVVEAHRASLDLAAAGIHTQLVVANQLIPADQATNGFFAERRSMQLHYLREIDRRFGVPVLDVPLLDEELCGIASLDRAADLVFGTVGSVIPMVAAPSQAMVS